MQVARPLPARAQETVHVQARAVRDDAHRLLLGAVPVQLDRSSLASPDLPGSRTVRERAAGFVVTLQGQPFAVIGFTVACGGIAEIDILADRSHLRELDLTVLDG